MLTDFLIELALTALLLFALLITCGVLWDARPPHGGPRR